MKIFPFNLGNSPERQRQRLLEEHRRRTDESIDVLHGALLEVRNIIGEIHEIGAENGLAMQKVTDWLTAERPPLDELNFQLADGNVLVDSKGALSRRSVDDSLWQALRSATDARMTSNPVARWELAQDAVKSAEKALSYCRRGYVDRQQSQPYPPLAVHGMDFQIRPAKGCSEKDVRLAEEKIRDLYAEGMGIAIDKDMKEMVDTLDFTLKGAAAVTRQVLESCDTAGLPLEAPASRQEIEKDDGDFDHDPLG